MIIKLVSFKDCGRHIRDVIHRFPKSRGEAQCLLRNCSFGHFCTGFIAMKVAAWFSRDNYLIMLRTQRYFDDDVSRLLSAVAETALNNKY